MSADEYMEKVITPEFGDEMNFQVSRPNPTDEGTFSREAIEGMLDQMRTFVLGRIFAQWSQGGEPPREMLATLKLSWTSFPEETLEIGLPWWNLIDGSHREVGR